jgi:hypothetical protein
VVYDVADMELPVKVAAPIIVAVVRMARYLDI